MLWWYFLPRKGPVLFFWAIVIIVACFFANPDDAYTYGTYALYAFGIAFGLLLLLGVISVGLLILLAVLRVALFVWNLWNRTAERTIEGLEAEDR